MHQDGQCGAGIARTLGVTAPTVYHALRQLGLKPSRNSRRSGITSDQIRLMVLRYKEGESTLSLSKEFKVDNVTIGVYLRNAGVDIRERGFQKGEKHPGWIGGRHTKSDGYVYVLVRKDDPLFGMAQVKTKTVKYALEHRIVMARHLGRPLKRGETVHHIDSNRVNNALENLQLCQGKHGKGSAFVCVDCGSHNIKPVELVN